MILHIQVVMDMIDRTVSIALESVWINGVRLLLCSRSMTLMNTMTTSRPAWRVGESATLTRHLVHLVSLLRACLRTYLILEAIGNLPSFGVDTSVIQQVRCIEAY